MKRNAGITLIALIITIVVLLILASATINLLFGDNNLIDQAKWSAFATDLSRVEEAVLLSQEIDSNGQYYFNVDNVFDGLYDESNISNSLKKSIVEARENKPDSGYSQDTVNVKYEALKNSEGKINGLYYVNKTIGGKEKAYLFDTESNTVFDVKGKKIYRVDHHIYRIGEAGSKPLTITKPEGADLSDHKDLEDGWIPIYTMVQFGYIASGEQNYEIRDLNDNVVGNYNMDANAKYRMMNDIDFKDEMKVKAPYPIKELNGGTFDGNGYYIKNIFRATSSDEYNYYSDDIILSGLSGNYKVQGIDGIFGRVINSKLENIGIDNAEVRGNNNSGILAGEIVGTTIENCIVKNSIIGNYNGSSATGILVGRTYNAETPTKISKIEINNVYAEGKSTLGGIIGLTATNMEISNCIVENSTIQMIAPTNQCLGGILGYIAAPNETIIKDCYVGKSALNTCYNGIWPETSSIGMESIGGIVGGTHYSLIGKIDITNCSVEELNCGYSAHAGGIIGLEYGYGSEVLETNIDKCNVKNVIVKSYISGGVLAYNQGGNINITNCNVQNFKMDEELIYNKTTSYAFGKDGINFGGILGFSQYNQETNIENCNVSDIKAKGYGKNVAFGGIAGGVYAKDRNYVKGTIKISGCSANNIQLIDAVNSGGILGWSDYAADLKVIDCNVNNFYTQAYVTGGVIGSSYGADSYEITNCKVDKFITSEEINMEGVNASNTNAYRLGGIFGYSQSFLKGKIIDCNVLNSSISIYSGDNRAASTAGITSEAWADNNAVSEDLLIKNCKVENSTIETKLLGNNDSSYFHACGIAHFSDLNIENCEVNKSHILVTATNPYEGKVNSYGERYGINANGIVSGCYNKGINVSNTKVSETEIRTNYGMAFGVTTYSFYNRMNISNVDINDCDIYAKYSAAGVTNYHSSTCNIDNVNVNNTNITSEVRHAAGIVGAAWSGTTISNCNVNNCKIGNEEYEASNGLSSYYVPYAGNVGGIVAHRQSGVVTNCSVSNTELTNQYMNTGGICGIMYSNSVNDCTVNNITINGKGNNNGGIVGFSNGSDRIYSNGSYTYEPTINNCTVNGGTIIGDKENVGGIEGINVNGEIINCTVKDISITAKEGAAGGIIGKHWGNISDCNVQGITISGVDKLVGGITSFIYNGKIASCNVTDSTLTLTGADAKSIGGIVGNGAVSTGIESCKVSKTQITGVDYVGGISGVAAPSITNCEVDNQTTLTGRNCVGGIQGLGRINANVTIDSCKVKDSTIKGTLDINYILGKNSSYESTFTGTKEDDVITNSTYENVTLTTI